MTPSGSLLNAGTWLTLRIYRNRIRGLLVRLRSPRYVIALVVGVAYLALVFGHGRGDGGPFTPDLVELLGGAFLAVMVVKWWLFGADRLALAFSPAEVGFLFPAPVTRSALLAYKLLRAQPLLLVNVVVWLVLIQRGSGAELPLPLYGLSLWGVFLLMFLHRLGVALTRDALTQHGRAGVKRHWLALVLLLGAAAALAVVFRRLPSVGLGHDPARPLSGLEALLSTPPLGWVVWPFRLVFLPLTATSAAQWATRFPLVLGLIGLHLLWIFRADRAFEEAALEASARRAELLERWRRHGGVGGTAVRRAGVRITLPSRGRPMWAIVWKNLTRLARTVSPGFVLVMAGLAVVVVGFVLSQARTDSGTMALVYTLAFSWVGVLVVLGPQWIRIDLRGDLDHVAVLRTWPVSGFTLMTGEVCSSAIVLSVLQLTLGLLGLIALLAVPDPPLSAGLLLGLALPAIVALGALNLVAMGLQNAGALLYPSWVRVEIRPGGIEAMGQHLLTASASILLLFLAALGPGTLGGGLAWLLWPGLGPWALAPGLLLAAAGLGLEAFLLLDWMGSRFERLDPSDPG